MNTWFGASALALASFVLGCTDPPPVSGAGGSPQDSPTNPTASSVDTAIEGLVEYAAQRRATLDFATLPPWSERSGSDPFALLDDGGRTLGLLRRGRVVVLDEHARTLAEAPTIVGATTLQRIGDTVVVAAEGRGELHVLDASTLASRGRYAIGGVASIRDIAFGETEGRLYLADPHRHRLLRMPWPPEAAGELEAEPLGACEGALSVARVGPWLVSNCLLGHRLELRMVDDEGQLGPAATIEHDGPQWSFDAAPTDSDGLHVLIGGVEDHPLDRTDGAFGYIDSFAFVYEVEPASGEPIVHRRQTLNVSEHGVVTPKHVRWVTAPHRAIVTGYGSDVALAVTWPRSPGDEPSVEAHHIAPGITSLTGSLDRGVLASPLLDAWVVTRPGMAPSIVSVADSTDDRTPSERLGEALAFTGLMAPRAISEGRRSRFTCETCHFEGRTDGRTHWTGREQVHATTKTLRGLLNNRPHFSRALDHTTAGMVHSEFRVANTGTDFDPWFSLTRNDAPWLDALGGPPDPLDPVTLRRALLDFLAAFTPEPNPAIHGLTAFTDDQAEGARLFAQHCASCHQPRLVSDDPDSAIAPQQWAAHILHPTGGIVWGSETRAMTGVEPYVHAEGPRTPSLRRLWVKRPLLTNGSAKSLNDVLASVRLESPTMHGGEEGQPLDSSQRSALAAFLDLL